MKLYDKETLEELNFNHVLFKPFFDTFTECSHLQNSIKDILIIFLNVFR